MYKYVGNGSWVVGIPARDISADEFAAMDAGDQATVKGCGLYKFVKQAATSAKE